MPVSRRPLGWLLLYALANAGGVLAYLPLLTLLLPIRVGEVAGDARLGVFTATVVAGALAASASNVLFGWLSDRSVARGGGRRGWVAAGIGATALSYAAVAAADTPGRIVVAIVAFQIAVNALLAPLLAIMADEVPDAQKGLAGGLLAFGAPMASAASALLLGARWGQGAAFAIVAGAVAAAILPFLALTRHSAIPESPRAASILARRDLAVAWGARLLVQIAGNVLSLYLLYYFQSIVAAVPPQALAARIGQLLTVAYLLPVPIAVLLGRLSDATRRRKPALVGTAALAAVGLVAMALARDWAAGATGFAVFAVGSAAFLALHSGFAMLLLPSATRRGRDLGLLNLTNTLPALVGPVLTWALATPTDFAPALIALAVLTAAGGAAILAVRGRD